MGWNDVPIGGMRGGGARDGRPGVRMAGGDVVSADVLFRNGVIVVVVGVVVFFMLESVIFGDVDLVAGNKCGGVNVVVLVTFAVACCFLQLLRHGSK